MYLKNRKIMDDIAEAAASGSILRVQRLLDIGEDVSSLGRGNNIDDFSLLTFF